MKEARDVLRAVWNGVVLAETTRTVQVDGNHYFPPESLRQEFFAQSATTSRCPWKGLAPYHTLSVRVEGNPEPRAEDG